MQEGINQTDKQYSNSGSNTRDVESTGRRDSEGDRRTLICEPDKQNLAEVTLPNQNGLSDQLVSDNRAAAPYRSERRVGMNVLGKRGLPNKNHKVLLHWMKDEPKKQLITQKDASNQNIHEKLPIKLDKMPTISISTHPLLETQAPGIKQSLPIQETGLRKPKKYTAEDRRALSKADKLVSYWRDDSRQVPIVFRELSKAEDLTRQAIQVVDLSNRKILQGSDIYRGQFARVGKAATGHKRKRARKSSGARK